MSTQSNFITEEDRLRAKETTQREALGIKSLPDSTLQVRLESIYWQGFKHALDKVVPEQGSNNEQ